MTKKITQYSWHCVWQFPFWLMTIQAASKPDIKVGDYVKMARITMPQFFGDV